MNNSQKKILAVFVPVIVLVLTFGIANKVLDRSTACSGYTSGGGHGSYTLPGSPKEPKCDVNALDFDRTWWIWLLAIGVIGFAEFKLFETSTSNLKKDKN